MKVTFRTYCGLAGDLQELIIAKKRLIKKLELLTGQKHVEQYKITKKIFFHKQETHKSI